jgi:AAA+ ATPase superfamily predicted ATPase
MDSKAKLFKPTFGKSPYSLIGREFMVEKYLDALKNYTHDDAAMTLFIGQRGMGKTAILNEIERRVNKREWVAVSVSNSSDLLKQIHDRILIKSETSFPGTIKSLNIGIPGVGVNLALGSKNDSFSIISKLRMLIENLSSKNIGVLFLIDEVKSENQDIRDFASLYQLFIREDLKVGAALVGLPSEISKLINVDSLTFLRRANRVTVDKISNLHEVAVGIRKTFKDGGKGISIQNSEILAKFSDGYPYLIQLIGSAVWDLNENNRHVGNSTFKDAMSIATSEMYEHVIANILNSLPKGELRFIKAMSNLRMPAELSTIAKRLDVGKLSSITGVRARLIEKYIIWSPRYGYLDFVLPLTADYFEFQKNNPLADKLMYNIISSL